MYYPKRAHKIDRARDVLEKKELYETQSQSAFSSFKTHIVFSSPQDVSKTSKQIWIFVQNRWVQDRALQTAVMDAYRSLLMHGEYPYAVVWLECKPDEIDVNIHPTKSQVKFQDSSSAFKAVHSNLRNALEKAPWMGSYQSSVTSTVEKKNTDNLKLFDQGFDSTFMQTQFKNKNFNTFSQNFMSPNPPPSVSLQNIAELRIKSDEGKALSGGGFWSSLQVIGQINLTYIVCQKEDRLIFVDQHAAHERVVYESLMQSWRAGHFEVQSYLFPLTIDLSEDQIEVLLAYTEEIKKLGFEIEQLGPVSIGIKSAPALIKDSGLPVVFEKMAQDLLTNGGSFAIEKKISDLFASMACHSVVRAGQSLSTMEMQELLKSMDEFSLSSFCPHGRPVSVETLFTELEKSFGRIN